MVITHYDVCEIIAYGYNSLSTQKDRKVQCVTIFVGMYFSILLGVATVVTC